MHAFNDSDACVDAEGENVTLNILRAPCDARTFRFVTEDKGGEQNKIDDIEDGVHSDPSAFVQINCKGNGTRTAQSIMAAVLKAKYESGLLNENE